MAELERQETRSRTWGSWPLVALAVGFVTLDLLAASCVKSSSDTDIPWSMFLAFGMVTVQVNLIAFWTAIGPGQIVVRFPWMVLAITLTYVLLQIGAESVADQPVPPDEQTLLAGVLLFSWLTATCWFFCYRAITRRRLIHRRQIDLGRAKFHLRHLIIATAVCGLTLAVLNWFGYPIGQAFQIDATFVFGLAILATVSQVIAIPVLVAAFWSGGRWWLRLLLLFWGTVTVTTVEIGVMLALEDTSEQVLLIYALYLMMNLTQCLGLLGALLLIRGCGYELKRVNRGSVTQEVDAKEQADVADPWGEVE